jgi:hypothetical protein
MVVKLVHKILGSGFPVDASLASGGWIVIIGNAQRNGRLHATQQFVEDMFFITHGGRGIVIERHTIFFANGLPNVTSVIAHVTFWIETEVRPLLFLDQMNVRAHVHPKVIGDQAILFITCLFCGDGGGSVCAPTTWSDGMDHAKVLHWLCDSHPTRSHIILSVDVNKSVNGRRVISLML